MSAKHEVEQQLRAGMPGSHRHKAQSGGKHQGWEEGHLPSHQQYDSSPVRILVKAYQCVSTVQTTGSLFAADSEVVTYIPFADISACNESLGSLPHANPAFHTTI